MKLLAFFLLQRFHQKPDNKRHLSRKKILKIAIVLELFTERGFHLQLKFLHFVDNKIYDKATCCSKKLQKWKPMPDNLNGKFSSDYTPECDMLVNESLMMWKGCLS
jgi:hypothetical protein